MRPLPPALLFDLDDTILSLSGTALPAWEALCRRFAPRLGPADPESLFAAIRQANERFWKDAERQRWGGSDVESARRSIVAEAFRIAGAGNAATAQTLAHDLAHEMADTFSRERIGTIVPFPGALETLARLRALGRRLALLTNGLSRIQRQKIEHFSLAPYFDCIVVEEELGAGKPNPRVFRHALAALGATPREVWMVGDNLAFDVAGAQQLGIHAIWHDVRGQGLSAADDVRPDRIITALPELLDTKGAEER
jgi:putative hydrolase of the HAD superfamily